MLKLRILSMVITVTLLTGIMLTFSITASATPGELEVNFQDKNVGDVLHNGSETKGTPPVTGTAQITAQLDPDEVGTTNTRVARIQYTANTITNFGPQYDIPAPYLTGKVKFEARFRFENVTNTTGFSLWLTTVNTNNWRQFVWKAYGPNPTLADTKPGGLEMYNADGGTGTGTWWGNVKSGGVVTQPGVFENGKWYKIVVSLDAATRSYVVSVYDNAGTLLHTTSELASPNNARLLTSNFGDTTGGFKAISFRYSGTYAEGAPNYVYYDDIKFYSDVTPYDTALAAVVKAEGSKAKADVEAATALVNALEDGADKTDLLARLDAIDAIWVDTPVFYLGSIAAGNSISTLAEGNVIATAHIESNNATSQQATLISALYKKVSATESVLVKCGFSAPGNVDNTTPIDLQVPLDVTDIDDGEYFMKAFVWNSNTGLTPLLTAPKLLPELQ